MTTGKPLNEMEFLALRKKETREFKVDHDKLRLIGTVESLQDQLRETQKQMKELAAAALANYSALEAANKQVMEARNIFTAATIDLGGTFVVDMARPRTPPKGQRLRVHRDGAGNVMKFEFEPMPEQATVRDQRLAKLVEAPR